MNAIADTCHGNGTIPSVRQRVLLKARSLHAEGGGCTALGFLSQDSNSIRRLLFYPQSTVRVSRYCSAGRTSDSQNESAYSDA
jgi:hypothetical protein